MEFYNLSEALDMENAPEAKLFEPFFQEIREQLERKGFGSGWVGKTGNVHNKCSFFHKAKSNENHCPCFEGYWLDGIYGAVKCTNVSQPLPGILKDHMCFKNSGKECPLKSSRLQDSI